MRVEGELIRGRAAVEGRIIGPVLDPPKGICESARLSLSDQPDSPCAVMFNSLLADRTASAPLV